MKDFNTLVQRRHPLYAEMEAHWNFLESTYEGGRAWFAANIFKYVKEGDDEYAERVKRAYRFNHTKQVVDLVDKHLFKMPVARNVKDAPESVKAFWKNSTLNGLDIDMLSRRISSATSRFGRVYVVVDSTFRLDAALAGEVEGSDEAAPQPLTVADKQAMGGRPYAYIVRPQDMLDMSYDDQNEIVWALVREIGRDDEDPLHSTGQPKIRYRLWTRDGWFLLEEQVPAGGGRKPAKPRIQLVDAGNHYLGVVPVVQADHQFSEEPYASSGLIDDIAYLDRANANYLSNLDAIIQDQTFSQLTMPAQGLHAGDPAHDKLMEMGTKRIFTYNGEAGQKPEYISPDPRQASMILAAIGKIINEIYHSVGLSAERTKDDNGGGVDNSSGVAKAYDFERTNSLLAAKAQSLQLVELRIARLVAMWEGEEDKLREDVPLVTYPEKFDTRSLYDEFEIAAKLQLLATPDKVRQRQLKAAVDKMFPGLSADEREELVKAIDGWTPTEDGKVALESKSAGAPDPVRAANTQKAAKELAA